MKILIHAAEEMDKGLKVQDIIAYDLDNLAPTLLHVYDDRQERYKETKAFSLISLVSMSLLELGVITEEEA